MAGSRWEYRVAIAEGPMSARQLTDQFGAHGWDLVDIIRWPHEGKDRLWHYFKRREPAEVHAIGTPKGSDVGRGTDRVDINKA